MKNIIFEVFVCMMLMGLSLSLPQIRCVHPPVTIPMSRVGGVATIKGYTGAGGAITIPSTLGGFPTGIIGYAAFNSANGHLITSVIIPDSVTTIKDLAFYGCTLLYVCDHWKWRHQYRSICVPILLHPDLNNITNARPTHRL